MIKAIDFHIKELDDMKKYPKELFYIGNTNLLNKRKISIVGSRNPNQYSKQYTHILSQQLSNAGVVIVSGGAMGVDGIAHSAAQTSNTIMVAGTGLDIRYPKIHSNLIKDIENNGLVLSQFKANTPSQRYNFPIRNELVVALGEVLVVTQADLNSGTIRSVEFALKMGKEIYVLPHRLGESQGTNKLLQEQKAKVVYDIDAFVKQFATTLDEKGQVDPFLQYCQNNPTYDEAIANYNSKVFEYELMGKIEVKHGIIYLTS